MTLHRVDPDAILFVDDYGVARTAWLHSPGAGALVQARVLRGWEPEPPMLFTGSE